MISDDESDKKRDLREFLNESSQESYQYAVERLKSIEFEDRHRKEDLHLVNQIIHLCRSSQ